MRKKWYALIILVAMVVAMIYSGRADIRTSVLFSSDSSDEEGEESIIGDIIAAEETVSDDGLTLWYTDDALTEFLTSAALSYQADTGMRVTPVLTSGVEFLERINNESIYDGEEKADGSGEYSAPDLYITTHDNLMRAYMAGLASPISDRDSHVVPANFPQTSLHAITCHDKIVAYPLYYETNFFLYNKTYMANMAKQRIESEADREEGLAAQAEADEGNVDKSVDEANVETDDEADGDDDGDASAEGEEEFDDTPMGEEDVYADPEVLKKLSTMIPSTIDDILTFANNYDAPDTVEAVFKWDVSDIFYNYFFIGNYVSVGGENGDDNTIFNIYNQQAVDCLKVYGNLNNFFSIDARDISYDSVLEEFMDGKTVFTVATTDAVAKIEERKKAGEFEYDYGVAVLPDISKLLKARGLSVTSVVAVNSYSDKKAAANDFADYLTYERAGDLYKKSGKIACRKNMETENSEIKNIMAEYEKSVSLPKMIETGNYWVQLEIAFTKVWNGEDPDETLKELSDTIDAQIDELDYHIPTQESIGAGAEL